MPQNQPNLLLILTDQQRLSTLNWYESAPWNGICRTPNLDRLRSESILFENAYTSCPLCSPARASIMTGLYPIGHGVTDNVDTFNSSILELPDSEHLLSRRLEAAGYRCGYSGKWHLGTDRTRRYIYESTPSLPSSVGFEGQQFPGHGGGGFYYPEYHEYQAQFGHEPGLQARIQRRLCPGQVPRFGILDHDEVEATIPYFLTEHTIETIERFARESPERPFFVWHNFWGPHEPYFIPRAYLDLYKDVEIPPWPNFDFDSDGEPGPHRACVNPYHGQLSWSDDWADAIRHYYAFMTLIDEQIGRLLDHLEQSGRLDDTLVVFTADHGETLGSHGGLMDKGLFHFEEIQRVPFLVKLPRTHAERSGGATPSAGSLRREFVSLVDIYPTLLDAAGAAPPSDPIHGRSLLDLVSPAVGRSTAPWREEIVVESEGCVGTGITLRTLRFGSWKYCFSFGMEEQLYNLDDDPHETRNLAAGEAHDATLQELRARLYRWMEIHGDPVRRKGYLPYIMRRGFVPEQS